MKKIIPITGLVLSMTVGSVGAATEITKTELNKNTGILSVEGISDAKNGFVSINIPKYGVTVDELNNTGSFVDKLLFSKQSKSDAEGKFSFTIKVPEASSEGEYFVYVGSELDDAADSTSFYYLDATSYEGVIRLLNSAAKTSRAAFDSEYAQSGSKVFDYNVISGYGDSEIKTILYNYAKDVGFSETDAEANFSVLKSALFAQLVKENRVSDAETVLDEMYGKSGGLLKSYSVAEDYKAYVDSAEKRAYFKSVFAACANTDNVETALTDAMLLTLVRYPENVTNLKTVFEKYSEYTKARTSEAGLSNYSSISGKTFADISTCVTTFNASIKPAGTQGGGGGGGGGGSSSSSTTPTPNDAFIVPSMGGTGSTQALSIKFEDLNSVQWAYSAISELYERKIVSGKSETRFAPNERVKREEFAKMMVDMAGVEVDANSNIFSDVKNGEWYHKYVNAAYKNGFLNGVGDGIFGTGREITRQDMCVMAYNALKAMGHTIDAGELTFADADQFGDYAKAPVAALSKAGIISGVGDNRFNPRGNATRAEAAVVIFRLLSYIEG